LSFSQDSKLSETEEGEEGSVDGHEYVVGKQMLNKTYDSSFDQEASFEKEQHPSIPMKVSQQQ